MSKNLYKYIGPEIFELSTAKLGVIGFKCSYPKDYNDPYELFLSIDTSIDTQLLAFYKESVGEIPQFPTTCFSKSPVVIPMWAHYGHSSKGFVIGCRLYKGYIGKSLPEKYLKDESDEVYLFNGEEIVKTTSICQSCSEPLSTGDTKKRTCSWCSITKAHEINAAQSNPYRVLQHAGILESHLKDMEDIYRGKS